jgi:hypothetical protein
MKSTLKKLTTFFLFLGSIGIIAYVITTGLGGNLFHLQPKQALLPTETLQTGFEKSQLLTEIQPWLDSAIQNNREKVLAYLIYQIEVDHLDASADKNTVLLWLAMRDAASGQLIPSEPGLAIARRQPEGNWQITLQADEAWAAELAALPLDLLSQDKRTQYLGQKEQSISHDAAIFTGYKLPWESGKAKTLTGSIGHVFIYRSCVSTCLYAFDFADGTMFPILAAKGGTVKYAVWQHENGNTESANYIVLEDATTSPVTYQVYLHLAKNSIPEALRSVGAVVQQGDFIGQADDTGYSTGHHLHFHVHTNASSYWGTSVDIQFEDVSVNGGRPRTCVEAQYYPDYGSQCQTSNLYISQNSNDHTPPTGTIKSPAAYTELTASPAPLQLELSDPSGIKAAELWFSQLDTWQKIADLPAAAAVEYSLDLCAAGIKNGPFSLGLILEDLAGNRTPEPVALTHFVHKSACSSIPGSCTPVDQQLALFSGKQYTGACHVLQAGVYNDLSAQLPADWPGTQSILLGPNTQAVLYSGVYTSGRVETLLADDPAGENNRVAFDTLQSLKVQPLAARTEPLLQAPTVNGLPVSNQDALTLRWTGAEGSNTYTHIISGPNGYTNTLRQSALPYWSLGSLPSGEYLWTMQAEQNGTEGISASLAFSVAAAQAPAQSAYPAPYQQTWENLNAQDWVANGDWKLGALQIGDWSGPAWIFGDGAKYSGSGDLTSPPIQIPQAAYGMLFSYFSDVENTAGFADTREVHISLNGSNFFPLYQLKHETVQRVWHNSPVFDLSPYAGQTLRFRFHFDALDDIDNQHLGWIIRNFRISPLETSCPDSPPLSTPIAAGQLINGTLCSASEIHTYHMDLAKNQPMRINFSSPANAAHPFMVRMLDAAGNPLTKYQSASFAFQPLQAGKFQIQVISASYPDGLSGTIPYQIQLTSDTVRPAVSFQTPLEGVIPQGDSFTVVAKTTNDQDVQQLNLYWHSPDWLNDAWQLIGSDTTGADGWSISFNQALIHPIAGSALWLEAQDRVGSTSNAVLWNLRTDQSPPETRLLALPAYTESTLIPLAWQTIFGAEKVSAYEIAYRINGSPWQTLADFQPADVNRYAFIGNPGDTYDFNIRAHDTSGNVEDWQDAGVISTTIVTSCTRDEYEIQNGSHDDTWQTATQSALNTPEIHNICEQGDTDWFALSAANGKYQKIVLTPQDRLNGLIVTLYDASTLDVLRQVNSANTEQPLEIEWTFDSSDQILAQVEPANGAVWGTNTRYEWQVQKPLSVLPIGLICTSAGLPALLLLFKKKKTA